MKCFKIFIVGLWFSKWYSHHGNTYSGQGCQRQEQPAEGVQETKRRDCAHISHVTVCQYGPNNGTELSKKIKYVQDHRREAFREVEIIAKI